MPKEYQKPELKIINPKIFDEENALILMANGGGVCYEEALLQAITERLTTENEFLPIVPCAEDYEREYLRLQGQLQI